jgi:hypothetical protein
MPRLNPMPKDSTFDRWTVIEAGTSGVRTVLCRCECGTEKRVGVDNLRKGRSRSCGCIRREQVIERNTSHGQSQTSEYWIWKAMIQRCTNPRDQRWNDYGGRGITVCKRWRDSFEAFYADMGPRPAGLTLERVNNDEGYSPENCKWATYEEQSRNQRPRRQKQEAA